jgi:hypothetical protein
MKKCLFVLALAVVLTFALTATAFADHSPSFYIKWRAAGGYEGANAAVPSPHAGYAEGTQKCQVCHAEHRAPVAGTGYADNATRAATGGDPAQFGVEGQNPPNGEYPADAGGANRAQRSTYLVPDGTDTQMLLQSSVAGACDYCHITSSVGGEQIYAGAVKYRLEAGSAAGGSDWEGGYAHNNACTACHAVHGAFSLAGSSGGDANGNIVFKGAAAPKVLKAYAKNASTTWQSAVVMAGTSANLSGLFANPSIVATSATLVAPNNVPLFASKADAIAGTNVRLGVDIADAQVTAFCTFCHENYGYASEDLINPQNVGATPASVAAQRALAFDAKVVGKGLFQGPWVYKNPATGTLIGVRDSSTATAYTPGIDGQLAVKNPPMKNAETNFVAAGDNFAGQAAFANSNTCRDCHDAGQEEFVGVMVQSWPHFTPGYFKFLKTADKLGGTMEDIDPRLAAASAGIASGDAAGLAAIQAVLDDPLVIEDAQANADGACLKCHVNAAGTAGIGITF